MSMLGILQPLTPADLDRALEEPDFCAEIVTPRVPVSPAILARTDLSADVRRALERMARPRSVSLPPPLDLEKAWHGLHFLLTEKAEGGPRPLEWSVLGPVAQRVSDQVPCAYDPPGYLLREQVQEVSDALALLSVDALRGRYSPARMERLNIYPSHIWARSDEDNQGWLLDCFAQLSGHYRSAVARGDAMMMWIR